MHSRLPFAWLLPPAPTPLLASASCIRLDLIRSVNEAGDAETLVSYAIHGEIEADDSNLLAALLSQFRTPRGEAGAA
jgi:hypothetical protein